VEADGKRLEIQDLMENKMKQSFFVICILLAPGLAQSQCPGGLNYAGQLGVEGSFNNNGTGSHSLNLPPNAHIDRSYQQTGALKAYGGGSDARSPLQVSQVPPGIYIHATGTEDHNKGWSVANPKLDAISFDSEERVTQWTFSMGLYCTVGSGEIDRTVGGCNVKVDVCYKPKAAPAAAAKTKAKVKAK
jgi:hypothetical protein